MLLALLSVSTLLLIAVITCVWLLAQRIHLAADHDRLEQDLARKDDEIESLKRERTDLINQLRDTFKSLAGDALQQSTEQFLKLARKTFEGEQKDATQQLEQRKAAIEAMIRPVRESLDKHAKAVTEIEKQREGAYHNLNQRLTSMLDDQRRLQSETSNLVKALRRPDVRGRWGEMQLRRVAELAGMIDRCDFTEQLTTVGTEGISIRPDMVVHLPAGRDIVVDSKTPIAAYLEAVEAETDDLREQHLGRFVRHVEEQIINLSSKGYQNQFKRSPDFVVMFIPGESFLQAALQRKPDLMEQAFNRNVVIATPSTLIGLLKAVAVGWREEQLADNARHISELGIELHSRISTLTEHLANVGKALDKAVEHYNKFVGSYETQVMVQARRFKELGADSPKELPVEIKQVDLRPREIKEVAD